MGYSGRKCWVLSCHLGTAISGCSWYRLTENGWLKIGEENPNYIIWPLLKNLCLFRSTFFVCFTPFYVNSRDWCTWKSKDISSFWNTQARVSGRNNQTPNKVTEIISHHTHELLICIYLILCIALQSYSLQHTIAYLFYIIYILYCQIIYP